MPVRHSRSAESRLHHARGAFRLGLGLAVALCACPPMEPTVDAGPEADAEAEVDGGPEVDAGPKLDLATGRKILAFLGGKTLVLSGTDLPPFPFGIAESAALGANTQCYRAITTRVANGAFETTVEAGALVGASDGGSRCDHTTTTATSKYTSTSVLVDNVADNAGCFDLTVDYGAFGEEGRGRLAPDGTWIALELYFTGKAARHRCEDGAVGAGSVELLVGQPDAGVGRVLHLSGNSVQVYRIQ